MAVTLTVSDLAAACRVGTTTEETAMMTRLLAVWSAEVERMAPDAPVAIQNEAVIRAAAYDYDRPTWSTAMRAGTMRNSGAGSLLMPHRPQRTALAVAE